MKGKIVSKEAFSNFSEDNICISHSNRPMRQLNLKSASLQSSLEALCNQKFIFRKPSINYGDADTYFKNTLRNNDNNVLELFKTMISKSAAKSNATRRIKKNVSTSFVKRKARSKNRKNLNQNLKETKSVQAKSDVFHSPNSQSVTILKFDQNSDSKSQNNFFKTASLGGSDSSFDEKTITNMSEDENFYDVEDEEAEENIDTDIVSLEKIINEASEELQRVSEETKEIADEPEVKEGEEEEDTFFDKKKHEKEEEVDEEEEDDEKEEDQEEENIEEHKTENEDNQEIIENEDEEEEETDNEEEKEEQQTLFISQEKNADVREPLPKFDPSTDAALLNELEEAEEEAKATVQTINNLKKRVTELLQNEKNTEVEAEELEEKNKELKAQMLLLEEKTKKIQLLMAQTNLVDKTNLLGLSLQESYREDVLPKVVVCGVTENNIPKLVLCDEKQHRSCCPQAKIEVKKDINIPMSMVPKFAKRLSDSYTMQERLASENADLESIRYKLQADLLSKDQTIEYLQRKLSTFQNEMRLLGKKNCTLNEKDQQNSCQKNIKKSKTYCGRSKQAYSAEIENRLFEYNNTTKLLEKQLVDMENDVKCMQNELIAVKTERESIEQHKQMITTPTLCSTLPVSLPCTPCLVAPCLDFQIKELKEQYLRLQDDFKGKVTEVACLRTDNDNLKNYIKEAEETRKTLETKIKEYEMNFQNLKGGEVKNKNVIGINEQIIDLEQQLNVAKQRFREAQDELEELRIFVQEQDDQMRDYRNKYLEAQLQVEEQRRQIDFFEMEASRVNEQVNIEIKRVKCQFQEKLQELMPLPELLQNTQLKLQEVQQMHLLAERNNEALAKELQIYKSKMSEITDQMNQARSDQELGQNEKVSLSDKLDQLESIKKQLENEIVDLTNKLSTANEMLENTKICLQTKTHEIVQLESQLESVREESARQVARNKNRCETVRRSLKSEISDLERQLVQSRAKAQSAQKDRDEIRQKMQIEISNLHEDFEDAQMRIRSLQGNVNFLKGSFNHNAVADNDSQILDNYEPCTCGIE